MSENRIAGVAYLKVDGAQFSIAGKFKYQVNRVKRETLVGQDGVHGYKEMPVEPYISGDVRDMPGSRVRRLEDIVDATITLELANGKTVVLRNAWWADASEVDTEEGTYPVKFCGLDGEELT
jgi:hypothetical protein